MASRIKFFPISGQPKCPEVIAHLYFYSVDKVGLALIPYSHFGMPATQ